MTTVGLRDIFLSEGSGYHHNWNPLQVLIRLDFFQHLAAAFLWQI